MLRRSNGFSMPLVLAITCTAALIFAPTAAAQDDSEKESSAFPSFDEVTIDHISPNDLPDYQPGIPRGARSRSTSDLPGTLGRDDLKQVSELARSTTIELIAVHTPPRPYRAAPMVYRGHAVWISPSPSGADPVLVATWDWLQDADEVYAFTGDPRNAPAAASPGRAGSKSQPLSNFSADNSRFLRRHKSDLIPLRVVRSSRHVNLAQLAPKSSEAAARLSVPEKGLILHDMNMTIPPSIFGYSPSFGSEIIAVAYRGSGQLEEEFSFYFLTSFSAILGAPIVGPDGRLLAITALRYPTEPDMSLAIPPGAIHSFLDTGRTGVDEDE